MDPLLLTEMHERIDAALAADPTLTEDTAIQDAVHGGTVHDLTPCVSRLCHTVAEQRSRGGSR